MDLKQRLLVIHNHASVTDAVVFRALAVRLVHGRFDILTVDVRVVVELNHRPHRALPRVVDPGFALYAQQGH